MVVPPLRGIMLHKRHKRQVGISTPSADQIKKMEEQKKEETVAQPKVEDLGVIVGGTSTEVKLSSGAKEAERKYEVEESIRKAKEAAEDSRRILRGK